MKRMTARQTEHSRASDLWVNLESGPTLCFSSVLILSFALHPARTCPPTHSLSPHRHRIANPITFHSLTFTLTSLHNAIALVQTVSSKCVE